MRLIVWLLAIGVPAFSFQDAKAPSGTIAGKVVNQATGAPLADAMVRLRYVNPSGADEVMVRQTNETGQFSFTSLWGAEWELSAECHGFAGANYRGTRYAPLGRFSLERNQQITDIVLKLAGQSVVTGKVSDAKGAPVEGAHVALLKAGYTDGVRHWSEVGSGETLDNGAYRIPRVVAGRYLVQASIPRPEVERTPSEDAAETAYAATYYPQAMDQALAAPIDVASGAETNGIDVRLVATRVFHVRGKLQNQANGRSLSAHVILVDRADQTKIIESFKFLAADSSFDFARIPPGSYLVYAGLNLSEFHFAALAVDVTNHDVEGLLLNMTRLTDISGVFKLKSEDRKVDLRKVSVVLPQFQAGRGPTGINGWAAVRISDDLTFRQQLGMFPNFVGFSVRVSDLPEGCYVASILYGGRELPEQGIEYSAGASVTITIGTDGGRVDGIATGKDDQPFGGAVVALFQADGKGKVRSLRANAQGAFQFKGIPPGDYTLIGWDDVSRDDLENLQFVKQFDSQAIPLSIRAGGVASASVRIIGQ